MAYSEEDLGALYDAYHAKTQGAPAVGMSDARIGADGILELTTGSPFPQEAADVVYNRAAADTVGTPGQRTFAGGMMNLANALSFGLAEEPISLINAGIDKISPFVPKEQERSYDDYLNLARSVRNEYREDYPVDAIAGDVVGAFASPTFGLGALKSAPTLKAAIKASTKAAIPAAVLTGFGESEGGMLERVEGALKSGATAAVLSPLITMTGRGVSKGLRPFTSSGQERMAAEAIKDAAGEAGVKNLNNSYVPSQYGQKTLAEVTQAPGMANLESHMRTELGDAGGNTLLAALDQRQVNRQNALQKLSPSALAGQTSEMRGNTIQKLGSKVKESVDKRVKKIWDAVGRTGQRIGIADLPLEASGLAENLKTPLGYSSDANKVINALFNEEGVAKGSLTIKEWQAIRSAAGEVGTAASEKGRNREAAVMFNLIEKLDEAAEHVANSKSPTAAKIPLLRKAIAATRNQKTTLGVRAPREILQRGDAGYRLRESLVPQKIINTPEGAKSFMKAFGTQPKMVEEAKGALLDAMASKSSDTWVPFFNKHKAQFRYIFGNDYAKVRDILADLASEKSVAKLNQLATGKGPITGQRLVAQKYLDKKLEGLFSKMVPVVGAVGGSLSSNIAGLAVGGTLYAAKAAQQAGQEKVKQLIVKALQSPEFAKELLSRPTTGWIDRLIPYLQTSGSREAGRQFASDEIESANTQLKQYQKETKTNQKLNEIVRMRAQNTGSSNAQLGNSGTKPDATGNKMQEGELIDNSLQPKGALPTSQPISSSSNSTQTQGSTQRASYTPAKIKEIIKGEAPIVKAIIEVESRFRHRIRSPKGAIGLGQLMPENIKKFGITDPEDPEQNIYGLKVLLSEELERYPEDPRLAIAAYNLGSTKLERAIKRAGGKRTWASVRQFVPLETREYVPKVLTALRNYA